MTSALTTSSVAFGAAAVTPKTVTYGQPFPPDVPLTKPVAPGPVPVVRGEGLDVTWTPNTVISGLYVRLSADNIVCVLDPTAGTFTIPGSITANLTTGQSGFTFIASRAGSAGVDVGGTKCTLKTVTVMVKGVQIDVQ